MDDDDPAHISTLGSAFGSLGPQGGALDELPVVDPTNYEIGAEIAKGGMGRIFAARDRRLDRPVAIKQLLVPSEALRRRFDREVRLSARLQHPSIVSVLEAGRWPGGDPFYAMKLVVGRPLVDRIGEATTLAGRLRLLPSVIAATDALAYAHDRGIIHRDLKPANVLVGDFGETVVIDWGLAKDLATAEPDEPLAVGPYRSLPGAEETAAGAVMGTPAYMPPEQARGEPVDQRADVYALGALLYHVLAGAPPYAGASSQEVVRAVLSRPPQPLERREPGVPADLVTIVAKAMAVRPDQRYPSAAELAADLKRFQEGKLVGAHAYSRLELVSRWLRRHRAVALLGAAALAALLLVGGIAVVRVRAESRRVARAAAEASARANELILTQAESALRTDPTRAVAWLKSYPQAGDHWSRVRALADDARGRGLSRRVLRPNVSGRSELGVRDQGRSLFGFDGTGELRRWDVASGRSSARCSSEPRRFDLAARALAATWTLEVGREGTILGHQPESGGHELVAGQPDVSAADISSDGSRIATGGEDGAVRLFDRRNGATQLVTWANGPVVALELLAGGRRLAIEASGRLEVWDLEQGALRFAGPPGVLRHHVAPDGSVLTWTTRDGLVWLDIETLTLAFLPAEPELYASIAFFPDGRVLVGDRKRGTVVWDPRQGGSRAYTSLPGGATAVSSDGRLIAAGSASDGKVRVLDLHDGDVRSLTGHILTPLGQLLFLPGDRDLVSSSSDGVIRIWSLAQDEVDIWRLDDANARKPEITVSPDGKQLVAADAAGKLWRRTLPTGAPVLVGDDGQRVQQLAFLPDGEHVLVSDAAGELARFTLGDGHREVIARGVPWLSRLLVSHDGRQAMGASYHEKQAWVWDLASGRATHVAGGEGDFFRLVASPDDRWLALDAALDGVHGGGLYELASGARRPLALSPVDVQVFGFTPSSRYLLAAVGDGTVVRYQLAHGERIDHGLDHGTIMSGLPLSDDLFLAASNDKLSVWLPAAGLSATLDRLPARAIDLSFSPSRTRVLGVAGDSSLFVWDLVTGERRVLRGHEGVFASARFSDDEHVVSSTSDGTVRIWTVPSLAASSPAATRAWLDELTSVELADADRREPACH